MMQPDMMHCVNSPELTVLERHRGRLLRWQHEQGTAPFQQQTQSFYNTAGGCGDAGGSSSSFSLGSENLMGLGEVVNHCKMIDPSPGIEYWGQLGKIEVPSDGFGGGMGTAPSSRYEMSSGSISRTASCAPPVAAAAADGQLAVALEKLTAPVGRNSFKKRRLERVPSSKGYVEDTRDKKIRGCSDETESKITKQSNGKNNVNKKDGKNTDNSNRETCGSTSKDNSKASEVQKPDYIHVRARRGQATDSHSLAERVRREKISERMKFLQDLVPGCNKVTGKAGMLDEIINYVQSLQRQVEFLSMKLATVNPRLSFDIGSLFSKEMNPTSSTGFPTIGISSELTNPTYLPFHSMQQLDSCSGLDMGINDPNTGLQKTTTAPMPISEPFFDSSCFAPSATWESEFQNLYNMELQQVGATAATTAYQLRQQYIGSIEATNMKMEI